MEQSFLFRSQPRPHDFHQLPATGVDDLVVLVNWEVFATFVRVGVEVVEDTFLDADLCLLSQVGERVQLLNGRVDGLLDFVHALGVAAVDRECPALMIQKETNFFLDVGQIFFALSDPALFQKFEFDGRDAHELDHCFDSGVFLLMFESFHFMFIFLDGD